MHVDVVGLRGAWRWFCIAVMCVAVASQAGAQAPHDAAASVAAATAAVREVFGADADVTVSEPVLSLTGLFRKPWRSGHRTPAVGFSWLP